MTGNTPNELPSSDRNNELPCTDRDYLEVLMNKIYNMKQAGQAYYRNKSNKVNERHFEQSRRELNEFYTILIKRGYDPKKWTSTKPNQPKLYEQH